MGAWWAGGGTETLSRSYNPTLEPIKEGRATIRLPSPAAMLNTSAGAKRLLGAPWGGQNVVPFRPSLGAPPVWPPWGVDPSANGAGVRGEE